MLIKTHQAYRKIVALCDTDLLGKAFEEGIKRIELKSGFFQGEEKDKEEVIKILKDMQKEDATFNIVGKESVDCALKAGVIKSEGIIKIKLLLNCCQIISNGLILFILFYQNNIAKFFIGTKEFAKASNKTPNAFHFFKILKILIVRNAFNILRFLLSPGIRAST